MLTDEQRAEGWIEHDGKACPVDLVKMLQGALELAYLGGRGSTRKDGPTPDFAHDAQRLVSAIIAYRPANA